MTFKTRCHKVSTPFLIGKSGVRVKLLTMSTSTFRHPKTWCQCVFDNVPKICWWRWGRVSSGTPCNLHIHKVCLFLLWCSGLPNIGLSTIDPLRVDSLEVPPSKKKNAVSVEVSFKNLDIIGLKNAKIRSVKWVVLPLWW